MHVDINLFFPARLANFIQKIISFLVSCVKLCQYAYISDKGTQLYQYSIIFSRIVSSV